MEIQELRIYSKHLEKQMEFYRETLGLELRSSTKDEALFTIGRSQLKLIRGSSKPYHFAINIPPHMEREALEWTQKRVKVETYEGEEIQSFESWNARAIYFKDADQNILEFIARKNLNHPYEEDFGPRAFLGISEIGVPVEDIRPVFNSLKEIVDLPIYDGSLDRFCAVGDEEGLFIFINKNEKKWFPTMEAAYATNFELIFKDQQKQYEVRFEDGHLMKE